MTQPTTSIKSIKILADLLEAGDAVVSPTDEQPGVIARIDRARKRLVIGLTIELTDGRSFEIGASKFVRQPVGRAA